MPFYEVKVQFRGASGITLSMGESSPLKRMIPVDRVTDQLSLVSCFSAPVELAICAVSTLSIKSRDLLPKSKHCLPHF